MKIIIKEITKDTFPFIGSTKEYSNKAYNKNFNRAFISYTSKTQAYLIVMDNDIKLTEISKRMNFEKGKIYLKDDKKNIINIGSYEQFE